MEAVASNKPKRVVLCKPDGTPYKAETLSEIDENNLKYRLLITQKLFVPKAFALNANGDPTHIEETDIGSENLKRITDIAYNANNDPETQEIRIKGADDSFKYGAKNTFHYDGADLQNISTEILSS
jgi:hypothetical protein